MAAGPSLGTIELVMGPMFGGKTETLLKLARQARLAGIGALLVKHSADRRYHAEAIATHAGDRQATVLGGGPHGFGALEVVTAGRLGAVAPPPWVGFVGVDEGQFFPDLVEACEAWAAAGLRVVVAALDGDADRRPFGAVCELVPRCERVKKLNGVCMGCRRASAFSFRLGGPPAAPARGAVDVGGAEKYKGVCRACHAKEGAPPAP